MTTFDLAGYAAAVFDLDGTVWLGHTPTPGALDFVARCRQLGLTITFATNATFASPERLTELLIECGLGQEGDGVVTGGSVVAGSLTHLGVREVVAEVPAAMRLAIEAEGIALHLTESEEVAAWSQPDSLDPGGRALVMGASRDATFGSVERIGHLAGVGHPLYVTSLDPGFPSAGRIEPGGGMLVAAARALYAFEPIVLGKPSPQYAAAVRSLLRTDGRVVMFGDSQRADMGIAAHLGADGVLIAPSARVDPSLTRPQYVTTGLHDDITPYTNDEEST
jgi:HAD superfamily hydrolase (TIGR01450 family)